MRLKRTPVSLPSPGVEWPVIARLQDGVVDSVELDDVPPTPAIVEADPRPGHVIDMVVADHGVLGVAQEHPRDLLAEFPAIVDQVVGD